MWRICNWSPLPGEWCHYDRDGQLRPDWRQDLRCWPVPDGERPVLPPRRLQDYITKVRKKKRQNSVMKGRILFHKHNQELRTKSKALVFLGFFFRSPFSPRQTFPRTKELLKLSPHSCSHLHTTQLIDISPLVKCNLFVHWRDYVGGIWNFRKLGRTLILDRQELTSVLQSSSNQLRVVASVWVIISVAQRTASHMNTLLIPYLEHWACFVQTLVVHWSGFASGSEQCPSSSLLSWLPSHRILPLCQMTSQQHFSSTAAYP